jgi:hypothetical protein
MEKIDINYDKLYSSFSKAFKSNESYLNSFSSIENFVSIRTDRIEDYKKEQELLQDEEKINKRGRLYYSSNSLKNSISSIGMTQFGINAIDKQIDIVNKLEDKVSSYMNNQSSTSSKEVNSLLKDYQNIVESSTYNGQNLLDGSLMDSTYYIDDKRYLNIDVSSTDFSKTGSTIFLKSYNDKDLISQEDYEKIQNLQADDKNLKEIVDNITLKFAGDYEAYANIGKKNTKNISEGSTDSDFTINGINIGKVDFENNDLTNSLKNAINFSSDKTGVEASLVNGKLNLNSINGEGIELSSSSLVRLEEFGILSTSISKYSVNVDNFTTSSYGDKLEFYDSNNNLLATLDENKEFNIVDDSKAGFFYNDGKIDISNMSDDIKIKSIDNKAPITNLSATSTLDLNSKEFFLDTSLLQNLDGNSLIDLVSFDKGLINENIEDNLTFDLSNLSNSFDDRLEFYDNNNNLLASVSKDKIVTSNNNLDMTLENNKLTLNDSSVDLNLKLNVSNTQNSSSSLKQNQYDVYNLGNFKEASFDVSSFGTNAVNGDRIIMIDNKTNTEIYSFKSNSNNSASQEELNRLNEYGINLDFSGITSGEGTFDFEKVTDDSLDISVKFMKDANALYSFNTTMGVSLTQDKTTTTDFGFEWSNKEKELSVTTTLTSSDTNQTINYNQSFGSSDIILESSNANESSIKVATGTLTIVKHSTSTQPDAQRQLEEVAKLDNSYVDVYSKTLSYVSISSKDVAQESLYILKHTKEELESKKTEFLTVQEKATDYMNNVFGDIFDEMDKKDKSIEEKEEEVFDKENILKDFQEFTNAHTFQSNTNELERLLAV